MLLNVERNKVVIGNPTLRSESEQRTPPSFTGISRNTDQAVAKYFRNSKTEWYDLQTLLPEEEKWERASAESVIRFLNNLNSNRPTEMENE